VNLIFKILWFDDRQDFLDSLDLEPFKGEVRSWGFMPEIELVTTPDDFMKRQPFAPYDLIVVDYNLEQHEIHGEDFIKKVRDNRVFTEIIFYSANPSSDLWAAIHQKQLEGVFVANRQVILEKLQSVAHQSVHKVLDLNNMRGMVMAEVGDIDLVIESIIKIGIVDLKPEEQTEIFQRFQEASLKQADGTFERLKVFKGNPSVDEMLELCDSYKRWTNFNRLKKVHELVKEFKGGNYANDVLAPRNHLAHGQPQQIEGGYIFRYSGKEYTFDEKASLALRKVILQYKEKFQEIHDKLSQRGA
jgi:hypothetical protein